MHADEIDVDVACVRQLLAEQLPHWAALAVEPLPSGGTDNWLYRLGDDMVVRLPKHVRTGDTLVKERRWLPALAPFLPLEVPLPLAEGHPADGYPCEWAVYRWLDGDDATVAPPCDPARVAADLGEFLAALQRVDPAGAPPPGEHNFGRGEPLVARDAACRAAIGSLGAEIDGPAVTAAWEEALAAPTWDRPPVWVHGDVDARNVLVRRGRLSAVIDWGCLGAGDPACDVAAAWKLLPGEHRRGFRTALGVDDATWSRARGWVLSQAVSALAYYTTETNAILVHEARRWLAEILTDGHNNAFRAPQPTLNGLLNRH